MRRLGRVSGALQAIGEGFQVWPTLAIHTFFHGHRPGAIDRALFDHIANERLDLDAFPALRAWRASVACFLPAVRATW
jgi:hypothetical protein